MSYTFQHTATPARIAGGEINSATAPKESEVERFLNVLTYQLKELDQELKTLGQQLAHVSFAVPMESPSDIQEANTPFSGRLRELCVGADELRRTTALIRNNLAI